MRDNESTRGEITRHTRARATLALIRARVDLLKAWGYFKAVARRPTAHGNLLLRSVSHPDYP